MARQTDVTVGATAIQLTNAAAAEITFQNKGTEDLYVMATAADSAPTIGGFVGWLKYEPGTGERKAALADLFPGVTSPARLWGATKGALVQVYVSHADA